MRNDIGELYRNIYYTCGRYYYVPRYEGNQGVIASGTLPEMLYEKDCYEKCGEDLDLFCNITLSYTYVEELLPPFPYDKNLRYGDMKYLVKNGNGMRITIRENGELKYYGTYPTVEDAKKARDFVLENKDKVSYEELMEMLEAFHDRSHRYIAKEKEGKYVIRKAIDGCLKYFGCFKTLDEAMKRRDALVRVGWDDSLLPPAFELKGYYYNKRRKNYVVQKRIDGGLCFFGYYDSKDVARRVVEKLKECNWDKKELPRIKNDLHLL